MKKLSLISIFFLALFMPAGAQPADTETGPIETLTLKKGDIPPSILQTCEQIFRESTQVKWGNFPYQLKKFGWVIDTSFYGKPRYYEVFIKTKEGTDVYAVFDDNGNLLRYRTIEKNGALPLVVLNAIAKTPYREWKVEPGTELITDRSGKVEEHYAVRVTKNNRRKTLYYTKEGNQLFNK